MAKQGLPANPEGVTFPFTVSDKSVSFKVYRNSVRGTPYFTIAYWQDKVRKREVLKDYGAVRQRAADILNTLGSKDAAVLELTAADVCAHRRTKELAAEVGMPMETAMARFVEAQKLMGPDVPIIKAVEHYLKTYPRNRHIVSVRDVVEELLATKKSSGVSVGYQKHLRYDLEKFATAFNTHISAVSGIDIDNWLTGLGLGPRTRNNLRNSIHALFRFAIKRKYLGKDHDEIEAVTLAKDSDGSIEIFTPSEFEEILANAKRELIPFFALGAFAGIRHAEIQRLHWEDIDMEAGIIEIKAAKAKTASRRTVPLLSNLRALLAPHQQKSGNVCRHVNMADELVDLVRAINRGRRAAWAKANAVSDDKLEEAERQAQARIKKERADGTLRRGMAIPGAETAANEGWDAFKWKHNALRHSFISYRVALTQNVAQVALEAGNSPQMIFKHYRELVRPAEAKKWFAIDPDADAKTTVIPKPEEKAAVA